MCIRDSPLVVTQGDGNLGVKGKNFEMLFSIAGAGPASLKVNGTESVSYTHLERIHSLGSKPKK